MSRTVIHCPGCQAPLGFPETAAGKALNCPHCRKDFHVVGGPVGGPPQVVLGAPPRSSLGRLPRGLIAPVFALLILGFAGTVVNGYLAMLFATAPNAEYDYAYSRVIEMRSIVAMGDNSQPTTDDWEQMPHAAVTGAAFAVGAGDVLELPRNVALARAWAPAVARTTYYSVVASGLAFVGGVCMLAGRCYWLALLGCLAAIVNVNHLCCIPGGVAGIWGILSLVKDEARTHFGIRPFA